MHATPTPRPPVRLPFRVFACWIVSTLLWTTGHAASAEDFVVTSKDDSGPGTLRQVLEFARLNGEPDTITFAITGTVELLSVPPRVEEDLQILGPGADQLTIRRATGAGDFFLGIFHVDSGVTATLSGLTIENGRSEAGAAVWNAGDLLLEACTITGNRSTILGNIYNLRGNLEIRSCLITGNTADSGAALANINGITQIINTTISGNTATEGPGISNVILNFSSSFASRLDFFNSTITQNSASEGGHIYNERTTQISATLRFRSSIVGGNSGNVPEILDFFGTTISLGHNFIGRNWLAAPDFPAGLPNANQDWVGSFDDPISPRLLPLQDNGGPMLTHLPLDDSLAIDNGRSTGITGTTDQRGEPRIGDGDCDLVASPDIGAVELQDCRRGTVNLDTGIPSDVLFVNDSAGADLERRVTVGLGESIELRLEASPAGPACGFYVLYAWPGEPANPQTVAPTGFSLGYAMNPIPIHRQAEPQPFRCLAGDGVPEAACRGIRVIAGAPAKTPWAVTRSQGLSQPITITLQALVEDLGGRGIAEVSLSNAIVLDVKD